MSHTNIINKQPFSQLNKKWKVLIIIGIISLIVMVGLSIFVILIFKTDVVPLEAIIGIGNNKEINLNKYNKFFDQLEFNELEKDLDNKLDNLDKLEIESDRDSDNDNESHLTIESNDEKSSVIIRMNKVLDKIENSINHINIDKKHIKEIENILKK